MINHYFDLQIRITTDTKLTLEEQILVQNYIHGTALGLRLASVIRANLLDLNIPYIDEVGIGNAALAYTTDMDDNEI